jgi:hypothetical protein
MAHLLIIYTNLGSARTEKGSILGNMDWSIFPKVLCEKFHLSFNKAFFLFGFSSGTENKAYLVTPQIAKGLIGVLQTKVTEYESKYGPIDMKGVQSGIESPIQLQ